MALDLSQELTQVLTHQSEISSALSKTTADLEKKRLRRQNLMDYMAQQVERIRGLRASARNGQAVSLAEFKHLRLSYHQFKKQAETLTHEIPRLQKRVEEYTTSIDHLKSEEARLRREIESRGKVIPFRKVNNE